MTINVRNEEEVDLDIIVDKVSKATGSSYSFKERGETVKESGPVGTAVSYTHLYFKYFSNDQISHY